MLWIWQGVSEKCFVFINGATVATVFTNAMQDTMNVTAEMACVIWCLAERWKLFS